MLSLLFQRPHLSSPADSLLEAVCLGSEWSWERVHREFRSEKLQATLSWLNHLLRGKEFQFYYLVILHNLEGRNERYLWYPSDEWRSGFSAEVFSDFIMSKGVVSLSVASCFPFPSLTDTPPMGPSLDWKIHVRQNVERI